MMLPRAFLDRPVAHRAFHDRAAGRPENSRAAIRAAVAAGYPIELDLQLSADGQAMVFHDYDLARLTAASGPVAQRTAAELGGILLRGAEDGIPTLTEVLEIVAGQVPLLIEVKDQDGQMGPDVGPLEEACARAIESYEGEAAIMSFNPHSVAMLARLCPRRPRGLTTCAGTAEDYPTLPAARRVELAEIGLADEMSLHFISHHHEDLDNPRVAQLKARGLSILCWTIRTPTEEAEARRIADNVTFEDYPA
jgi:glycerophosphoryl diester phosphodiesterase